MHAMFGEDVAVPISLEPDVPVDGLLAIGAASTSISALGVERYESAAYNIAEQVMEPGAIRDRVMPCTPSSTVDTACAAQTIDQLGRRAFRRNLTDAERARYVAIADASANKLGDFHDGLELALGGLLMSPHFLYRVEIGEPHDGRTRYTDHEMATRLAFLLWNTTPDDALLDAADNGELTDVTLLEQHVARMLEDPRLTDGVQAFFTDRHELYRLDDLVKDSTVFTDTSADLGGYAREETLSMLAHVLLEENRPYSDVLTTRTTFLNRKLASLYGVPAPALEGFAPTVLPENGPRAGLLGHASLLALHAHPVSSSATLRGKFIRLQLLCHEIPPPPADVDTSLPEPSEEKPTLRDRIALHLEDPTCAGCHTLLDPIGLGLERFDGLGRFRLTENDAPIDPSGSLGGTTWSDARGLGETLAAHPDLATCLTRDLYRYAVGAREQTEDAPLLAELVGAFADQKLRLRPLLRLIVLSDGFRYARPRAEERPPAEEARP